ncbi:MAG: tetratricopeptide repeat protein [Clostridia bacterium]
MKFLKLFNRFIFPILMGVLAYIVFDFMGVFVYALLFLGFQVWKRREKLYAYFGRIAHIKGNHAKSAKWYLRAHKTNQKDVLIANDAAYTALRLGDLENARKILETVDMSALTGEAKVKATNNLSILYWKSGDLPRAIEALEHLYAQNEKSTSLYGNLTYYYILNGDLEKALQLATEAIAYNAKDIVIIENIGRILHLLGRLDEARLYFEKLAALAPSYPEAWYHLALYYEDCGQKEKALGAIKKGLLCNFSFLSNVTKEQFDAKLKTLATAAFPAEADSQN